MWDGHKFTRFPSGPAGTPASIVPATNLAENVEHEYRGTIVPCSGTSRHFQLALPTGAWARWSQASSTPTAATWDAALVRGRPTAAGRSRSMRCTRLNLRGCGNGEALLQSRGAAEFARDVVRISTDSHEKLADSAALRARIFTNGHGSPPKDHLIALIRSSRCFACW
jgi:hypothetical protein